MKGRMIFTVQDDESVACESTLGNLTNVGLMRLIMHLRNRLRYYEDLYERTYIQSINIKKKGAQEK